MKLFNNMFLKNMQWYSTAVKLAAKVEVVPTKPRTAATMRHHANIPAENQESHFKRNSNS